MSSNSYAEKQLRQCREGRPTSPSATREAEQRGLTFRQQLGVERSVSKYGHVRSWRRNRLIANGFALDAYCHRRGSSPAPYQGLPVER